MQCPSCDTTLTKTPIDGVMIDVCPACGGTWYDRDELRAAKDARLHDYHWYDLDLWKHDADFFGAPSPMTCPSCDTDHPLTTVRYANSSIRIDVCATCHGIWLDKNELVDLLSYIRESAEDAVLHDYLHTLTHELSLAVSGTDAERTTLLDIATLVDFFKYKFVVEHERLARILVNIPR